MIDIYNRLATDQSYVPQVETSDEMEQLISQIKMILGTSYGDILGQPYFGANIKKYIFSLSYNQKEISQFIADTIMNNISYDQQKFHVDVDVEFGKDVYNKLDYAIINININQKKCLGIVVNQ